MLQATQCRSGTSSECQESVIACLRLQTHKGGDAQLQQRGQNALSFGVVKAGWVGSNQDLAPAAAWLDCSVHALRLRVTKVLKTIDCF